MENLNEKCYHAEYRPTPQTEKTREALVAFEEKTGLCVAFSAILFKNDINNHFAKEVLNYDDVKYLVDRFKATLTYGRVARSFKRSDPRDQLRMWFQHWAATRIRERGFSFGDDYAMGHRLIPTN